MMFRFCGRLFLICFFASLSSCGKGGVEPKTPPPSVLDEGSGGDDKGAGEPSQREHSGGDVSSSSGGEPSEDREGETSPSVTDGIVPGEPEEENDSSALEDIFLPQPASWKITWEEIAEADFFEEKDSIIFRYYVQSVINPVNNYIISGGKGHSVFDHLINILCPQASLCSEGLSLKQIDRSMISRMVHFASQYVGSFLILHQTVPVLVLQGTLSTQGSVSWRQLLNEKVKYNKKEGGEFLQNPT